MTNHVELRSGIYRDSVTLLQVSKRIASVPEVDAAIVAMATELNLDLAHEMGFDGLSAAKPNELLVAIRGTESAIEAAQSELEAALTEATPHTSQGATVVAPRTVAAAIGREPESNLVLLSIPGANVMPEALDAINAGRSVMIFSDNVPVEHEIILKDRGRDAGVLVMGPDCGTAIVGGVALGFANTVRTGDVGIVAASGTGAQQISCLLDWAGYGVSHLLGVGGRDLSEQVAARSTLQALAALAEDPATRHIIVVSKPTTTSVRQTIAAAAADLTGRTGKSVNFCILGHGEPTMTEAVETFISDRGDAPHPWIFTGLRDHRPVSGSLRGLFSGGTLADEAMVIAAAALGEVYSNIPLSPDLELDASLTHDGHVVIDFGDDTLTRGRAHPMIDPTLRLERLASEAADETCGVILLDVVLGYVADPDPAASLAPVIKGITKPVIISLIGTHSDQQDWHSTADRLAEAGAEVYLSNSQAATRAVALLTGASR